MSKSEAVVIESIEVRELLRFLFYLDILNKLSLLQRKHSKYMYAKCLNFPCFITYLAACMHAFCMFYLFVSLGDGHRSRVRTPGRSYIFLFFRLKFFAISPHIHLPKTFFNTQSLVAFKYWFI